MIFHKFFTAAREVYGSWKYIALTVAISIAAYWFNVLIKNYRLIFEGDVVFAFWSVWGSVDLMPLSSYLFLSLVSILTGIVVTYMIFLLRRQVREQMGMGVVGVIAGVVAPGCASCALGIFSLLGLTGLLAWLPFQGVELAVLGLGLLIYSWYVLSKKIVTKVCEIKKN
ncbi:hypothetical protein HYV86_06035 [Candidatus Woesearchaeota archaeon]|nr:hypothetical protein [Candidatus Woesearchaeota archaeon]